jgi:RES domain-containing protein
LSRRPDDTRVRGEWLRHAAAGLPPFPPREDAPDNRWQRGRVVDALYLAESEATVWAEWYRHLAESGIPPQHALPRDLWRWSVDAEVADLRTEEKLADVGLPAPTPGRSTWPPFQAVGEELWRDGWSGFVAPSAARPAGLTLCLFRDERGSVEGAEPVGRPRRIDAAPAPPVGMTT